MTLDTDRLRELLEKATPGEWAACTWDPMERPHIHLKDDPAHRPSHDLAQNLTKENADLIVAAVNNLGALLDRLDALAEENTRLRACCEERDYAITPAHVLDTWRNVALGFKTTLEKIIREREQSDGKRRAGVCDECAGDLPDHREWCAAFIAREALAAWSNPEEGEG